MGKFGKFQDFKSGIWPYSNIHNFKLKRILGEFFYMDGISLENPYNEAKFENFASSFWKNLFGFKFIPFSLRTLKIG